MSEERLPSFIEFILMANNYGVSKADAQKLVDDINEDKKSYVDYLINHVMKCLEKPVVNESINTMEFSEMYNKVGTISHLRPDDDITDAIIEVGDFFIDRNPGVELNLIYQAILDLVEIQAVIYNMFNGYDNIVNYFALKKILCGQIINEENGDKLTRYINEHYGVYKI